MALGNLTSFDISNRIIYLAYSDGREWYVPYKAVIATQIDPTSGVYEGYIYEKGLVGESLKATQPDLVALGSSVVGFISSINNGIGILLDYDAYEVRADADGSTADSKLASDCGLSAMLQILI